MTDRAQFTTGGAVRSLITAAIVLLVLALVVEEALSAASLAAGEVEQVCGLCHVDWRRNLAEIGIITGLVIAANWLLGGPKRPPEGDDDDE